MEVPSCASGMGLGGQVFHKYGSRSPLSGQSRAHSTFGGSSMAARVKGYASRRARPRTATPSFWTSERDLDKSRGSSRKGRSVAELPANALRGDLRQDLGGLW